VKCRLTCPFRNAENSICSRLSSSDEVPLKLAADLEAFFNFRKGGSSVVEEVMYAFIKIVLPRQGCVVTTE
jgi:hypothetical protein